ncbi:MAG: lipocalin-like domain-containing protein, partial [Alcaligenaceae bacterium]
MKKMKQFLIVVVCAGFLFSNNVSAQQSAEKVKSAIIGSWDLIGDTRPSKDGTVIKGMAFGENPTGRFIFLSNGQYFTLATRADIPKFASGNRYDGTAEEHKAAVRGSIGHYGTYSISEDGKEIILKAIAST